MAGGGNGRNGSSEQHGNRGDPNGNLTPFQFAPGESGNPAGRPKGAKDGLRATLRKRLKSAPEGMMEDMLKVLGIDAKDKQNADVIVDVLFYKIATGDIQALKLAFDQTEEPLKHTLDLGDSSIKHEHRIDLSGLSDENLELLKAIELPVHGSGSNGTSD